MTQEFDLLKSPIEGVNLIEASAGTGKTYTIVGVFLRLLLKKKLPIEKILVVTFTEAATAELKERIGQMIRKALSVLEQASIIEEEWLQDILQAHSPKQTNQMLQKALLDFDESAIFTIHGFCRKMLQEFAFETHSSFESELIPNQDQLLEELAKDYWRETLNGASWKYNHVFFQYAKSPQSLLKEFQKILLRPKVNIIPALEQTPEALCEAIDVLFQELKSTWEQTQTEIETLLATHKIHNKRNLPNYCDKANTFFNKNNPFLGFDILKHFSSSTIEKKAKTPFENLLFFEQCEQLLELGQMLPHAILNTFFDWMKPRFKERKRRLNQQSFDDLLQDLHQALKGETAQDLVSKIQKRFEVALIDEFQDTDPIQYQIFKKIFGKRDLFLIGDPKQAIYNFRGADIFTYLQAKKEATHQFTLNTNWRSDLNLVQAVNTIFCGVEHPFISEEIPYVLAQGTPHNQNNALLIHQKASVPLQIWFLEHKITKQDVRKVIAESTASEITRLLNLGNCHEAVIQEKDQSRPVQPEDIAVLVRTHNEAEQIRKVLTKRNIPCVLKTQKNIFQTDEFEEVLTIAFAIEDPTNIALVKAALLTDMMGYSGTKVFELMQEDATWETLIEDFYEHHQLWKANGFYPMMRDFLRKNSVQRRLLLKENGERRVTNILHALEVIHQAEAEHHWKPILLLRWARFIQDSPEEAQEEHLIRLETDTKALTILTVHACKGLEFPIVFCPFSWGNRKLDDVFFHDSEGNLFWDLSKQEPHKEFAKQERLAEDIRLVYVALTRAKHCCYVAWGNINQTQASPLAHLFWEKDSWQHLKHLEQQSCGTIKILEDLPSNSDDFSGIPVASIELQYRTFQQSLRQEWAISSFSALSRKSSDWSEGQDHDQFSATKANFLAPPMPSQEVLGAERLEAPADAQQNAFNLPKGANTGNCFHEILECLNFKESHLPQSKQLVCDKLRKYHFDPQWELVATSIIQAVCHQSIPSDYLSEPFTLADLSEHQIVKEMPFYFPIGRFSTNTLKAVVQQHRCNENHDSLLQTLNQLDFQALKGFMKGYLDLVFCYRGRYYILDWKTNHVGTQLQDYAPHLLKTSVETHLYNLQYYIYTVALHKYLRMRIPNYRFKSHFGGVYYFFLRGIQGTNEEDFGVYYDSLKNSENMIEQLENAFQGNP